jgi:5-methylcytosine-specific restriction enzyme subunit McrC
MDTPRNRLVRAALDLMGRLVRNEGLAGRCRASSCCLARLGVGGVRPPQSELARDQICRNDSADRFMIVLAQLAFEMALPTEVSGTIAFVASEREEAWVRRLYEKAVLGFARVELEPLGWSVRGGVPLNWQASSMSDGIGAILPRMVTDIILEPPNGGRIVVDTKFSSILQSRRFGGASLKSGYLYQMYAYVRSQKGLTCRSHDTTGLLLHPAIEESVCERVGIQGHSIAFATVDLTGSATAIRKELRRILSDQS